MKKTVAIFVMAFMISQAWGLGMKVGIGGDVSLPQGDWKDNTNTGFGGSLYAVLDVMVLKVTGDVGYISYGTKTIGEDPVKQEYQASAIPLLIGLRYDFGAPVGPKVFAGVKVGTHLFSSEVTSSTAMLEDKKTDKGKFTIAPYVGVSLLAFELTGHYMIIDEANYIGLRLAYTLGIGM
jgi:hypothetical protein